MILGPSYLPDCGRVAKARGSVLPINQENDSKDVPVVGAAGAQAANLKEEPHTFSDYDVRIRARQIWERNGMPDGHADYDWNDALAELAAEGLANRRPVPVLFLVSSLSNLSVMAYRQNAFGQLASIKGHA